MLWGNRSLKADVDHAELKWAIVLLKGSRHFSHTKQATKGQSLKNPKKKESSPLPLWTVFSKSYVLRKSQFSPKEDEAQQESISQREDDDPDINLAKKLSLEAHQEKGEEESNDWLNHYEPLVLS
ncbi:hypothetical protein Tco_0214103 [Tanacetum coccineum]